jgi:hypothetical protein
MSVNSVPPGRTSPYQKGDGASTKLESSKVFVRQSVLSGREASLVPRRNRQVEFVENKTAACAGSVQHSSPRSRSRVNMANAYHKQRQDALLK